MAEPRKRKGNNEEDELVKKLVPDPANPPDAQILRGFLGKSARSGYRRLYLTPDMGDYLEINEEDILHSQSSPSGESILEGSIVWVKRDASIQHTTTRPVQAQAEFLQGDVSAALRPGLGAGPFPGGPPAVLEPWYTPGCTQWMCPPTSDKNWCSEFWGACHTNNKPHACPDTFYLCPIRIRRSVHFCLAPAPITTPKLAC